MVGSEIIQFPGHSNAAPIGRRLIPGRIRDARKALRLTQEGLGQSCAVTRQAISAFEAGSKMPDAETFNLMLAALRQPRGYFTTDDRPTFGENGPRFFRRQGPERVRLNEACAVLGNWFVQSVKYLDEYVNYPEVNLPSVAPANGLRYDMEEIEEIAARCRVEWGLGLGPLSNVVALAEGKGVITCRYELENEQVDAFSFWNGTRPFVFMVSEKKAGVRIRFDVAHELGHLILHRWLEQTDLVDPRALKCVEAEADRFAGALLLPRASFPYEVYTARLDAFLDLKRRWGVSIQALVYRCKDLDVIDESQFVNLYKQISFRRWRKSEPLDDPDVIRIEQPKLLSKAATMLLGSGKKHPGQICADLGIAPDLIASFWNVPTETLTQREPPEQIPTLK
jgi:Zn-dependent peptidase ImmA (M78 family)/DNA-binding XRE family transcriptional regulator